MKTFYTAYNVNKKLPLPDNSRSYLEICFGKSMDHDKNIYFHMNYIKD